MCYLFQSWLLKRWFYLDSTSDVFVWILQIFLSGFSKEHQWPSASVITSVDFFIYINMIYTCNINEQKADIHQVSKY